MFKLRRKKIYNKDNLINQTSSFLPTKCQQNMMNRKYGMFIHFGINTFNNTEWSNGKLPVKSYAPTAIDADQWVKNAYLAGMNYIILITKHHDGFCLWDTKYTDYCVNNTLNKTDVVKAVSIACEKYGIKLGLYYSLWDRHEPCYSDDDKYIEYMLSQLEELLNEEYGEIVELWLDGGWDKRCEQWGIDRIYDLVKRLQSSCAMGVNNTIGKYNTKGHGKKKYLPENYEDYMPMKYFPSDFRLQDPHFTKANDPKLYLHNKKIYYLPFEATICIRAMKNWFWDSKYLDDELLSVKFITDKYKHLIEQSNSLVINVAPNINGLQESSDIDRLLEVADKLGIRRNLRG